MQRRQPIRPVLVALMLGVPAMAFAQAVPVIVPVRWPTVVYPQIAQSARVSGDVSVDIEVRPDGGVAAARAVNGSLLLSQAAEDAAKRTRFECRGCREATNPYTLYVTFRLATDEAATPVAPLVVSPTQGWVTVVARFQPQAVIAEEWVTESERSAWCLWIWRCRTVFAGFRCVVGQ